jgi:23S rRNA pseudouridine1911/1915/1917 synthase
MAEELENSVNYKGNPEEDRRECIVPETLAGQRLDQALSELYPEFSRSRLQTWIKNGKAQVDGDLKDPSEKVWGGEKIVLWPEPEPGTTPDKPEAIPLKVVFEDAGILVIDKPAGMVVHPGNGNPTGTLLNALLHHCPQVSDLPRAGIVHRLDKETSGLLVVAKTLKAHADLVRQLQARTVKRDYFALVQGEIDRSGTVDMPLARDPLNRTRRAVHPMGKPAVTHYSVLERFPAATLLKCSLETGRTHQIRVHMAHLRHPLVGDKVYGSTRRGRGMRFPRHALHAHRLGLVHPYTGKKMEWESPLPPDLNALLDVMRKGGTWM